MDLIAVYEVLDNVSAYLWNNSPRLARLEASFIDAAYLDAPEAVLEAARNLANRMMYEAARLPRRQWKATGSLLMEWRGLWGMLVETWMEQQQEQD